MEVVQVLHMNGGSGETSYANNSLVQRKVILLTRTIIEEAITQLYSSSLAPCNTLCVAELGCSSGPNALFVAGEIVEIVLKICRKNGHSSPEFQIHLNDLPGNDFNSIFQSSLPTFQAQFSHQMEKSGFRSPCCFVSGVPGSFYGRLFPAKSLHFVHSSYSLMWLSKRDFSTFLRCRSEEVVSGGRMVLTILGRKSDDASSKECCYIWELLALSLQHMVSQGVIEKEKLHSFNIPQYTPSPEEVKKEVEKEGSFTVDRLEASEITWAAACDDGYNLARCMRSVAEPLLVEHFGEVIIDQLFQNYSKILSDRMSEEDAKFFNVTVSVTRI